MQKINSTTLKFINMKIPSKICQNSNFNTAPISKIIITALKGEKGEFKVNKANRNKNNIKGVFTKFSLGYLKHFKYDFYFFYYSSLIFLINIFSFLFFKEKFHN